MKLQASYVLDTYNGMVSIKILGKGSAFIKKGKKEFWWDIFNKCPEGFYSRSFTQKRWNDFIWVYENRPDKINISYHGDVAMIKEYEVSLAVYLLEGLKANKFPKEKRKYAEKALFSQIGKMLYAPRR